MSTDEAYAALKLAIGTLNDNELIAYGITCLGQKRELLAAAAKAVGAKQATTLERVAGISDCLAALVLVELEEQRGKDWDGEVRRMFGPGDDR